MRIAPRYAVIAALIAGAAIALFEGDIATSSLAMTPELPTFIAPQFSLPHSLGIAVPLFLVTMASQDRKSTRLNSSHRL